MGQTVAKTLSGQTTTVDVEASGTTQIFGKMSSGDSASVIGSGCAFAAAKADGSAVTWGLSAVRQRLECGHREPRWNRLRRREG